MLPHAHRLLVALILWALTVAQLFVSRSEASSDPHTLPLRRDTATAASKQKNGTSECYQETLSPCQALPSQACLDFNLAYKETSNAVHGMSEEEVLKYLHNLNGLRKVPNCWRALQSVICTSLRPRCLPKETPANEGSASPAAAANAMVIGQSFVSRPTFEMCRTAHQNCKLVSDHFEWPEFLDCANATLYPRMRCTEVYKDFITLNRSDTTRALSRCAPPLLPTKDPVMFYPNIPGCGLPCKDPLYSDGQHEEIASIIKLGGGLSLVLSVAALLTFLIDWKSCKRYPPKAIFNLNLCIAASSLGWLLQFVVQRERVVCRVASDHMIRRSEPGSSVDSGWCTATFFLIYYFSLAAFHWFAVISYAWYTSFRRKEQIQNLTSKYKNKILFGYFPWTLPALLVLLVLMMSEVQGDSIRGICFLNTANIPLTLIGLVIPFGASWLIGTSFLLADIALLVNAREFIEKLTNKGRNQKQNLNIVRNNNETGQASSLPLPPPHRKMGPKSAKKIRKMVIRIVIFGLSATLLVLSTLAAKIHDLLSRETWMGLLNDFIVCSLRLGSVFKSKANETASRDSEYEHHDWLYFSNADALQKCYMVEEQSRISAIRLQLVAVFLFAIACSSWVWTADALSSWRRFLDRKFQSRNYHMKPQLPRAPPHELISRGFHRRKLNRLPSIISIHRDPVGMNITSVMSQELSATWQAALPNLMHRRGAIDLGRATFEDLKKRSLATYGGDHYIRNRNSNVMANYSIEYSSTVDNRSRSESRTSLQESLQSFNLFKHRHQRRKTRSERRKLSTTDFKATSQADQPQSDPTDPNQVPPSTGVLQSESGPFPILNPNPFMGFPPPTHFPSIFSSTPPFPFAFHPQNVLQCPPQYSAARPPSTSATGMAMMKPPPRSHTPAEHPFTHGMSSRAAPNDHTLVNPFQVNRRPLDEFIPNILAGQSPNMSNLQICPMASAPTAAAQTTSHHMPQQFPNYEQLINSQAMAMANIFAAATGGISPAAAAAALMASGHGVTPPNPYHISTPPTTLPPPPLYHGHMAFGGVQPPPPPSDRDSVLNQERERYAHLIRAMDSASEMDVHPNDILISDSESVLSSATRRSSCGHLASDVQPPAASDLERARELVEARLDRFTATTPVAADGHPDSEQQQKGQELNEQESHSQLQEEEEH